MTVDHIWLLNAQNVKMYLIVYLQNSNAKNETSVLNLKDMPAKRTYDVDTITIDNRMSEREQKIFTLLKEWREYKFIAKQFNLAASDIGKIVRKYLSKQYVKNTITQ